MARSSTWPGISGWRPQTSNPDSHLKEVLVRFPRSMIAGRQQLIDLRCGGFTRVTRVFAEHRKSATPVTVKGGDQVYDESLLIICHFRKNRQGQDFPAGCLGFRQITGLVAQSVESRLQV